MDKTKHKNPKENASGTGIRKNDLILALAVMIAAGIFFAGHLLTAKKGTGDVQIQINGRITQTLSLKKDCTVEINGGTNTVQIKNGKVRMSEADCPDQICVHQKEISRNGESIICLPNKIVLKIVSEEEPEMDAVTN